MNNNDKPLHYVALSYLAEHQGAYLEHDRLLLIDRCVAHLIETQFVSKREANVAAMQAYGEHESRSCRAYIDMTITTSHTLFIREPGTARLHAFTVAELVDMVKASA